MTDWHAFYERNLSGYKLKSNGKAEARCPFHDDKAPSFEVNEKGFWRCYAGCGDGGARDFAERLGIPWDVTPRKGKQSTDTVRTTAEIKAWPSTVDFYEYENADGKPVHGVLRKLDENGNKKFVQYRSAGPGCWQLGVKGLELVPFRLPELLAAVQADQSVFICEGEKATISVTRLGLCSTNSPGGAGKWRDSYTPFLQGADVVILPDNDVPGRKHAQQVAESLHGIAARIRMLELPNLPVKGDPFDWVAVGGTREQLEALAAAAPLWEPPPEPNAESPHLTDLGNSQRLVDKSGQDFRFCPAIGWLVWDGKRFRSDDLAPFELAKTSVLSLYAEAADPSLSPKQRNELLEHAKGSESQRALTAAVNLTKSHPKVRVEVDTLDQDRFLLNVENGTLDLLSGTLRPHRREDLLTKLAPVRFAPGAACPTWEAFLNFAMDGNQKLVGFLQRAVGYALTGDTSERALFICHGGGRNGKSTFIDCICELQGRDYATHAQADLFLEQHNQSHPTGLARLNGMRFVAAVETEQGRRLAESLVKQITGRDRVVARYMRKDFFEFVPQLKLWLATNHRPAIRDTTQSMWDRIRLIPWTVRVTDDREDKQLPAKLREEFSGILAWAVRGCQEWLRGGLAAPPEVMAATQKYQTEEDRLAPFLEQCCIVHRELRVGASALYKAYCKWASSVGKPEISQRRLSALLKEKFQEPIRSGANGGYQWKGLGLRQEAVSSPSPDPSTELLNETELDPGMTRHTHTHIVSYGTSPQNGSEVQCVAGYAPADGYGGELDELLFNTGKGVIG